MFLSVVSTPRCWCEAPQEKLSARSWPCRLCHRAWQRMILFIETSRKMARMCTKITKTFTRVNGHSQGEDEDEGAASLGNQGQTPHYSFPSLSPQAHTVSEIQRRSESARAGLTKSVVQTITATTAMTVSSAIQSTSPSSTHSWPEDVQTWGSVKDILGSMQTRAELAHHRLMLLSGAKLHNTLVH